MALASYFSKNLLAINQIVNTDQDMLIQMVEEVYIRIVFDQNCASTFEGRSCLDLLVRVISRLYPKLQIDDLSGKFGELSLDMRKLALSINTNLDIMDSSLNKEDVTIVLGETPHGFTNDNQKIYIGSDNWIARYSLNEIQGFRSDSTNPFGAGCAACIAASNIFRFIFLKEHPPYPMDKDLVFNTFTLREHNEISPNPKIKFIPTDDLVIAGVGALGNGVLWGFKHLEQIKGDLHLVDAQPIDHSNLQRYILTEEKDEGILKTTLGRSYITNENLKIIPFPMKWEAYLQKRGNSQISCVLVCLDSGKDRIGIQGSLPKVSLNAFLEPDIIGLTRHFDFLEGACLACMYIPKEKFKNRTQEIADNCNIPQHEKIVNRYYNEKVPVDTKLLNNPTQSLLELISDRNGLSEQQIKPFKGMLLDQFYSEAACSGRLFQMGTADGSKADISAPLAFQSAMGGLLLAGEFVKHKMDPDSKEYTRTDIGFLRPIARPYNPLHRSLLADTTGRCLCSDKDFQTVYAKKWKS